MNFGRMRALMDRIPSARRNVEKSWSRATKCTQSFSDVPVGGSGDSGDMSYVRYVEAKESLNLILTELQQLRAEAEPLIDNLTDYTQRTVMKLRYIDGYDAGKIAVELHYSDRHIFRLLRAAEQEIG